MAKEKEILSLQQKQFLDFAIQEEYIVKNFYLTGGTALAAFYLHHRISEDLDFFNEKEEVNLSVLSRILGKFSKEVKIAKIEQRSIFGIHNFFFYFPDKEVLKIDFSYYPFPRIDKGSRYKNLIIDSEYDIAVNKIHTVSIQPRARDLIDLYFLIKEKNYGLRDLLTQAKAKFDWHIDPVQLGSRLVSAREVKDFPHMLKKINHQKWQNFFAEEARRLGKEVFDA